MLSNKALSVEELNHYIHSIFLAEEMLLDITLFGEVSGFKISGPHAYFTLKGENAAIACNSFNYARSYVPKDGETVLLKGSPSYYEKTGKLSFIAKSIQPIGQGKLHAEFEALKVKLSAEGLFDQAHKKAIPVFAKDVCVFTSKTGAVIRDIYRTVRLVNQSINLHVFNVRVQGEGAENEIADAIKIVDGKYDAIIVARGGGSLEDLMPFNTEIVARAVYEAQTPIISAVGHETDYTLCDFSADARAATPTAAATLIAYDENAILRDVFTSLSRMATAMQGKIATCKNDLITSTHTLLLDADNYLLRAKHRFENAVKPFDAIGKNFTQNLDFCFERTLNKLSEQNPCTILSKGYFGVSKSNIRVTRVSELAVGDDLEIFAQDGKAKTTVKEIIK